MERPPPEKFGAARENAASPEMLGSCTDTISDKAADRQARWRSRNPEKLCCHIALKSALRRGLVIKQPCENCGGDNSEAHHHRRLRQGGDA